MFKKIDKLLITSFIGPFVVSFGIALFVLIMQFLWLYIDEIAGKGVSIFIMAELIGYLSVATFPMALAIAMLVSSVMVMGNLSERYELASMKSAGISLIRVMRSLIIAAIAVSLFSYVCSNYLIPIANLQFKTRLYDIRKQKPALTLEQGVFNEDFRQFVIRISDKERDGETIKGVLIDDQTGAGKLKFNQILADSGQMFTTEDKHFFVMNLFEGTQYQEPTPTGTDNKQKYPFIRTNFQSWSKVWDLKEFEMNRTDPGRFNSQRTMMTMTQLRVSMDSLNKIIEDAKTAIGEDMLQNLNKTPEKKQSKTTDSRDAMLPETKAQIEKLRVANQDQTTAGTPKSKNDKDLPPGFAKPQQAQDLPPGFAKPQNNHSQPTKSPSTVAKPTEKPTTIVAQKILPKKPFVKTKPKIKSPLPPKTVPPPPPTPKAEPPKQILEKPIEQYQSFEETIRPEDRKVLLNEALSKAKGGKTMIESRKNNIDNRRKEAVKTGYELYTKYSFALVCFVFLFIGAPMGAIIRKGGFGYPLLISIIFFVTFIVLTIFCRKLAESYVMTPFWAAMMPCIILMPIGAILTTKATNDSQMLNTDRIDRVIAWLTNLLKKLRILPA
jgi:lipopolysaccharide export system permease protein